MSRPCQRTPWRTSWRASRWPSYSPAARVPSGSAGREPARRRTSRLSEGRYDRPGLVFRDQPSRGRAALLRIRRLGVRFPPSAPHLTGVDASTRRCSAWSRPYSDPYSCRDNDRYRDGRRRARRGTGSMRERRPGVWENRDRRGEGRGHGPVGAAPSPSTAAQRSPSHAGGSWSSASGWTGARCTARERASTLRTFSSGSSPATATGGRADSRSTHQLRMRSCLTGLDTFRSWLHPLRRRLLTGPSCGVSDRAGWPQVGGA